MHNTRGADVPFSRIKAEMRPGGFFFFFPGRRASPRHFPTLSGSKYQKRRPAAMNLHSGRRFAEASVYGDDVCLAVWWLRGYLTVLLLAHQRAGRAYCKCFFSDSPHRKMQPMALPFSHQRTGGAEVQNKVRSTLYPTQKCKTCSADNRHCPNPVSLVLRQKLLHAW
jgi:hypothetical protein